MNNHTTAVPKLPHSAPAAPLRQGILQRKCACSGTPGPIGECETCRKKREAATLQRAASHTAVVNTAPLILHEVLRSPGHPLDPATRAFLEPRFGQDFSPVRVHTDTKAAESAWAANALAYTVGQDVVFGIGEYQSATKSGRQLIAHELAHVPQQQTGAIMRQVERNPSSHVESCTIRCPDPRAVATAFSTASAMISTAQQQMERGPIAISDDSRDYTPMHHFYMLFFKVERGLKSPGQILEIKERFQALSQAASSTRTGCVSGDNPDCQSGEMHHSAFAKRGSISLCPRFFESGADERARTVIHELAHARLGVTHKGGRFLQFACVETPVKTFDEAIDNAYVYDGFAYCLHAAASLSRKR